MAAAEGRLLRTALERRLRLVEARLDGSSPEGLTHNPAADHEEVLRVLMVRLWPRLSDHAATLDERARFFGLLGRLWEPARSDDLRFLDAWNNAYEVAGPEFPRALLAAYAQLLSEHVRRFTG